MQGFGDGDNHSQYSNNTRGGGDASGRNRGGAQMPPRQDATPAHIQATQTCRNGMSCQGRLDGTCFRKHPDQAAQQQQNVSDNNRDASRGGRGRGGARGRGGKGAGGAHAQAHGQDYQQQPQNTPNVLNMYQQHNLASSPVDMQFGDDNSSDDGQNAHQNINNMPFTPKKQQSSDTMSQGSKRSSESKNSKGVLSNSSKKSYPKQKVACKFNMKCTKPQCTFDHQTSDGKSPAASQITHNVPQPVPSPVSYPPPPHSHLPPYNVAPGGYPGPSQYPPTMPGGGHVPPPSYPHHYPPNVGQQPGGGPMSYPPTGHPGYPNPPPSYPNAGYPSAPPGYPNPPSGYPNPHPPSYPYGQPPSGYPHPDQSGYPHHTYPNQPPPGYNHQPHQPGYPNHPAPASGYGGPQNVAFNQGIGLVPQSNQPPHYPGMPNPTPQPPQVPQKAEWTFTCNKDLKKQLDVLKAFKEICKKNPGYFYKDVNNSDQIQVEFTIGPQNLSIKDEFENCLPESEELKLLKDTNIDHVIMIVSQFEGNVLPGLLKPIGAAKIKIEVLRQEEKIEVTGQKKHQNFIKNTVIPELKKYMKAQLFSLNLDTSEIKIIESVKQDFNIENQLKELKNKYPNIIHSYDLSKRGKVEIVYWKEGFGPNNAQQQQNVQNQMMNMMISVPPPTLDQVKAEVLGIMPVVFDLHLHKDGIDKFVNVEKEVLTQFQQKYANRSPSALALKGKNCNLKVFQKEFNLKPKAGVMQQQNQQQQKKIIKRTIQVIGEDRDRILLQQLLNEIKVFYDREYTTRFTAFPPRYQKEDPKQKRAKQRVQNTLFDIDDDNADNLSDINSALDSDDDDNGSQDGNNSNKGGFKKFMPNQQRYYLYKYFEQNQADFKQNVIEAAGVDPSEVQLSFDPEFLKIDMRTTRKNYSKIQKKFDDFIKNDIVVKEVKAQHFVACVGGDNRIKRDFKGKFEQKYKIKLLPSASVFFNNNRNPSQGGFRGGKGGQPQGDSSKPFGSFTCRVNDVKTSNKEFQPLNYSYVIIGNPLNVDIAAEGIDRTMKKYVVEEDAFARMKEDQFKKYISERSKIQRATETHFHSEKNLITYLGKQKNILKAKDAINDLKVDDRVVELIQIEPDLHKFLLRKKDDLRKISSAFKVRDYILEKAVELTGTKDQVNQAIPKVQEFIQDVRKSIGIETVHDKNQCYILQELMKDLITFLKNWNVKVTKIGQDNDPSQQQIQQQQYQQSQVQASAPITYTTVTHKVQVAQWSYKVKPGDGNYNQRTDTKNDFMDFDPDQSWQVENHYIACVSGRKSFDEKFTIIGDMNQQKNGWLYSVWGSSQDPLTWQEQNVTLLNQGQNPPIRQLNRRMIEKEEKQVAEEIQSSNQLNKRHGLDINTFLQPHTFPTSSSSSFASSLGRGGSQMQSGHHGGGLVGRGGMMIGQSQLGQQVSQAGYQIVGLRDQVNALIKKLRDDALNPNNFYSIVNVVDFKIEPEFLNNLKLVMSKKFGHHLADLKDIIVIQNNNSQDVQIVGFKHNEIKIEVARIIDKAKSYIFPNYWENQVELLISDNQVMTKQVAKGTSEWNRLETGFKLTMSNSTIHEIVRIQNRKLWRVFQNEVEDMKNLNGGVDKIAEMYHGTSATDPKMIYTGLEGFDMRYSRQGMWGHANYFAKNASYSNSYAYTIPNGGGKKQMFVANVFIGVTIVLAPDNSLKVPPINPNTKHEHDSVQGHTGGSDVIMVYSNKKAYPQYLLTYS